MNVLNETTSEADKPSYPREKIAVVLLLVLASACVTVFLLGVNTAEIFFAAFAFPFAHIGRFLRFLSLSGGIGNIFAIALYVIFCLIPVAAFFIIRKKGKIEYEDALLLFLSALLFYVMFLMVNPGLAVGFTGRVAGDMSMAQMILGGTVYSIILSYILIRILRRFIKAHTASLEVYTVILLHFLSVLFTVSAFGVSFGGMLESFETLRAENIGNMGLGTTYVFITIRYAVTALPNALNIAVVFAALRLLSAFKVDPYSQNTVAAAEGMSRMCGVVLVITVLSVTAFNVLQLIFASRLFVINTQLHFPVVSVLFVLGALLLTRYIAQNKQIKDENDRFV